MDTFVYELGLKADTLAKCKKIDQLKLTENEWQRIELFAKLLAVSDYLVLTMLLIFYSMQIMLSRVFPLRVFLLYNMLFLLWRLCSKHGLLDLSQ